MSQEQDCIFCKIAKKEIPCFKVYEDESTLGFMDISPVNHGHVLVIPKRHSETLLHMEQRDALNLMKSVQLVSDAVKKATNADGINILMNNFKAAGQIVPHAHFHIIPRFKEDGLKHWPAGEKYKEGEMEKIQRQISDELL